MATYGRLRTSEHPYTITEEEFAAFEEQMLAPARRRRRAVLLLSSAAALLLVSAAAAAAFSSLFSSSSPSPNHLPGPTAAISRACSATRHASLCRSSLSSFPSAANASGRRDLVHVSLDMTLKRVGEALYGSSIIADLPMEPRLRSAFEDCLELMEDSVAQLSRSRAAVGGAPRQVATEDVRTWLSAALTNQDTCTDGLDEVGGGGNVKEQIVGRVKDLSDLVSNTLAIFSTAAKNGDFDGIPIENRRKRRRLLGEDGSSLVFPEWVGRRERRLLETPVGSIKVDFVVSKDGNGTHTTIQQAVKHAPKNGTRRFVIYIKAGRYDENVKVGRSRTNLMFVGDGKSYTIIAGCRSVYDNFTTFRTATFAVTGEGFIARDITFQNWAGPEKHQAVALRVGSDHSVVYRCNVIGYQDTLYVHSQRQFYRECDIYGTVDFIFGNAAVVLQNCSIWARKPLPDQKNTITAQNRKDPNQNTAISVHASRVYPTADLARVASSYPTYLGRPWKQFARTVFMMTYMGSHVHPAGWLEWSGDFALDTLYYGEYMNYGPGAAVGSRVKWPGYRVIGNQKEAGKFTVAQLITGSIWLPSTGVEYLSGLTL